MQMHLIGCRCIECEDWRWSRALKLISHKLCPYVQRAVIALNEKGVAFERIDIDLANKPDWFLKISPLGKTPVLLVGDTAIFESAVILRISRGDPAEAAASGRSRLQRAEHRGWIEFGSTILSDIAGFYAAKDEATFKAKTSQLEAKFRAAGGARRGAPWFDGEEFSLVDAVFGPVFRYFDVFDDIADFGILAGKPKHRALAQATGGAAVSAQRGEGGLSGVAA